MNEVVSITTNIPYRNEVTQQFADATKRLNNNAALQIPWRTDGNQSKPLFRLLLENWVSLHTMVAAASGGEEDLGKYEKICVNIKDQVYTCDKDIFDIIREWITGNDWVVAGRRREKSFHAPVLFSDESEGLLEVNVLRTSTACQCFYRWETDELENIFKNAEFFSADSEKQWILALISTKQGLL